MHAKYLSVVGIYRELIENPYYYNNDVQDYMPTLTLSLSSAVNHQMHSKKLTILIYFQLTDTSIPTSIILAA